MSHHITEVNKLNYSYPDGNQAIKDVSFRILHGESVALIGANGAGKSTMLLLLIGILFPAKGEISIGHVRLTKKTLSIIRQHLGMVFQNPDDQLFMISVYDDVAFGPRNYKLDEKEVAKRVKKSLSLAGILHLKDRAPYKLSAGEKRLAAIAAVLAMYPDILLMDEPTSALDPCARRCIISRLKNFSHTKIIATHDLDMVLEVCERTIVLKNGKIAADGDTGKILADEKLLKSCNLELPFSMLNCPRCGERKI